MSKLQLSIYQFVLKEKGKSEGSEYPKLGDFYRENFIREEDKLSDVTREKVYHNFIEDFIDLFNDEFQLNKNETKGIGLDYIRPYPSSYIIDGILKGGPTGIEQEIFDKEDMETPEGVLAEDKLTTLPYYFKLWSPYDNQSGILMIQSYTDYGVNTLILSHIKEVFRKYNTSFITERFIPKILKEEYINDSQVYKIAFLKNSLPREARERFNPVFTDYEGLKVKIEITGFNDDPENFLNNLFKPEHKIGANLSDLGIGNEEEYETVVYYKDEFGHRTHAKAEKQIEIRPTIYLSDSLKMEDKDFADYEKVRAHTDGILETIKVEIGYKPIDNG
ncbi:hypothetical protein [Cellulophaga lytica]|uniref:hypothetical protein n=1 Tax=Cellulophaga lytica TaxID=979 RepID=UPI003CE4D25A